MLNPEQKKKLSEFCFDVSKLTLAGLVIGGVLQKASWTVVSLGMVSCLLFLISGLYFLRRL